MRFAIVTPSFNQALYLNQTLQSVAIQQGDFEINYWVQDGGSSDDSVAVLKKFQSETSSLKNFRFGFESRSDSGQAHAIHLGFQKVSGDIYAYINSDDFYEPGVFARVARFFEEHPNVDVVYGQRNYVNEAGKIFATTAAPFSKIFIQEVDFIPQETVFWRKAIWEKAGARVDVSFHFAMDYELWLRFLKMGARFAYVPQVWANFRIHSVSKTQNRFATTGMQEINRLRNQNGKSSISQRAYFLRVFLYRVRYFWSRKIFWNALLKPKSV